LRLELRCVSTVDGIFLTIADTMEGGAFGEIGNDLGRICIVLCAGIEFSSRVGFSSDGFSGEHVVELHRLLLC
jgi:hypothetical protein